MQEEDEGRLQINPQSAGLYVRGGQIFNVSPLPRQKAIGLQNYIPNTWFSNQAPEYLPKGIKNLYLYKNLPVDVYSYLYS